MKRKYLEWECEFLFIWVHLELIRVLLFSRAKQTVNLIPFSISESAEIKDNILFTASPTNRTDGNHWTTAETETQPQNSPEVGLLPNTNLLPLDNVVKHRSVCTQHAFWVENICYFLGPQFLRPKLQRWWSTNVKHGDLDITFLWSLLLNSNPALISPNSIITLEFSVNTMLVELLWHCKEGARKRMPQSLVWWGFSPLYSHLWFSV